MVSLFLISVAVTAIFVAHIYVYFFKNVKNLEFFSSHLFKRSLIIVFTFIELWFWVFSIVYFFMLDLMPLSESIWYFLFTGWIATTLYYFYFIIKPDISEYILESFKDIACFIDDVLQLHIDGADLVWEQFKFGITTSFKETWETIVFVWKIENKFKTFFEGLFVKEDIYYKLYGNAYADDPTKSDEEREELRQKRKKLLENDNLHDPVNFFGRISVPFDYTANNNFFVKLVYTHTLVVYNFFKSTIIALFISLLFLIYAIFFFKLQFLKQLAVWFIIGMLYFWLMSGFNFFLKRYQFGKFTSQIQRFWKRTNTYFWLIEGFLILLFFYYYLNSSQEPVYMYDYSALNQEYLLSLHTIGLNIIILSLVIYFMYFTMLRINTNTWSQLVLYLFVISIFIFFSFYLETYQMYYVISTFNERVWTFNEEDNLWSIEIDNPILRTKHQYLLVCLIAKYWHFLFIFLSWVFFLIKSLERKKVTYVLFGANLQNIIILYALNFACYLQWFKWIYRRFFDLPYTWFMTNIDAKFFFRFFMEIKLIVVNLINLNNNIFFYPTLVYKTINLWEVNSLALWKLI